MISRLIVLLFATLLGACALQPPRDLAQEAHHRILRFNEFTGCEKVQSAQRVNTAELEITDEPNRGRGYGGVQRARIEQRQKFSAKARIVCEDTQGSAPIKNDTRTRVKKQ